MTRLYVALGVAAMIGFAWWRYDHIVTVNESQRVALESSALTIKGLNQQIDDAEKRAAAANDRLIDHIDRLEKSENETKRLRDCVDAGTCGLRIKTVYVRVPQAQGESGTGDLQTVDTELAPESRRAYFTHRAGIDKVTELLQSCIKELEARTMCY